MNRAANTVVSFARPLYELRDSLHGWDHVERILYWATQIWEKYLDTVDRRLVYLGAVLHGPVNDHRADVESWLSAFGYPRSIYERILTVTDESQTKNRPLSIEGKILHDAHTIEGGSYFRVLKPLLTGTYMRQPLDDTLEFIGAL